jgi:hypothetical protein
VRDLLEALTDEYEFEWVGAEEQYRYKGDIKATAADGSEIFIEVKDDTIIGTSGNVLIEEEVYFKEINEVRKGFIHNDYDIFCVISRDTHTLYFFKYDVIKEIYKNYGEYKFYNYPTQSSECRLLPLCRIKQFGGLIAKLEY